MGVLAFVVHLELNDNALIEVESRTLNMSRHAAILNLTKCIKKLSSLIWSDDRTILALNMEEP